MKSPQEILNKHLHKCYITHSVKIHEKDNGYILRAMEEYKNQSLRHRFMDWLIKKF